MIRESLPGVITAYCDGCAIMFDPAKGPKPQLITLPPQGSSAVTLCGVCAPKLGVGINAMMESAMAPIIEAIQKAEAADS